MISVDRFLDDFGNDKNKEIIVQLAKVDPNYTTGRPCVVYDSDIETGTLSKPLPYLSSYAPAANDRIMILKGVIVGKII